MVDMKAMLEQLGFESTEDKRKREIQERDKRNGAIDKDKLFGQAYAFDKDRYYQVTGTIDAISPDKDNANVTIVSLNTIHIYINGEHYIANHTHLRGDRVKLNPKWRKGQDITITVKIMPYRRGSRFIPNKYELVNIF